MNVQYLKKNVFILREPNVIFLADSPVAFD